VQYFFHGTAAHAASALGREERIGRSLADERGMEFRREHLRLHSARTTVNYQRRGSADVVPSEGRGLVLLPRARLSAHQVAVRDRQHHGGRRGEDEQHDDGSQLVGSAWPPSFNKIIARRSTKNMEAVGMPKWSEADQTLAKALQKEIGAKVEGLKEKSGAADRA